MCTIRNPNAESLDVSRTNTRLFRLCFPCPGRLVRVGGPYCEYGRSQPHAGSLARRSATFEPWRVAEHV